MLYRKLRVLALGLALLAWPPMPAAAQARTLDDIPIRDPFIYADPHTRTYYLYQAADTLIDGTVCGGVRAWQSKDLKSWYGPRRVCTIPATLPLHGHVWAPEMHVYKGKYYLFLTLNSDLIWKKQRSSWPPYTYRAVQVLRADRPEGPFRPIANRPTTPLSQMALDGTLYVEDGQPYLIYCNEWVQRVDGAFRLARLKPDLSVTEDDGEDLFCASAAPWSTGTLHSDGVRSYVSDGCFLWHTPKKLLMIYSSFADGRYAVGVAESTSGRVAGPWKQHDKPLYADNGGHGMIFRDFNGQLWLLLHSPNSPAGQERAHLIALKVTPSGDLTL